EKRILEVIKEQNLSVDISNLNVFTFHSYALDNIEENEILSTNLLRYTILKYLKENEILNYSDEYLIDTIVPKMENLMRYLKSFGITPDKVDISEAKKFLEEGKNYTKEEIDKFAEDFLAIFENYEQIKNKRGVDYADLLIKFLALRETPEFDYVLVDELQDVNIMEADIALKSGKTFFAVGDKKQAIFGFQGGSILNFKKFEDSTQKVLSENFRSTNEILDYAKEYFISRTKEMAHKEDLKDLCSAKGKTGLKPVIYDVSRDKVYAAACELAKGLEGKTAIIVRTNYQIMDLSRELDARGMEFSSTFFSASNDAKNHIINFLKGVLSSDVNDVKNAMFTPFFPCSLQQAFELSSERNIKGLFEKAPAFKELRDMVKTVEDVNMLFKERIIPICISYGKEYVSAGTAMQTAYQEAISFLSDKNMNSLVSYLQSTDLLSQESDVEKDIVLTTVHKAKGKEFDNVIYIPTKTNNRSNFQDSVVEGILKSKGVNVEEELEEETLRINFVAFTRAENKLIILSDKIKDYLNDYAELKDIAVDAAACLDLNESRKRAFDLFVNKQFDEAKELLDSKNNWIKDFVKGYFESLEHISFSSLPENAYDYFVNKLLGIRRVSFAVSLGSEVHEAAKQILLGQEYSVSEDAK
ncbi:MAG TPA: ATP-dependent helicase, partial [Candidatus Woesearchaeota archaeon]|nr:ATP-dependent helicase [Candidatus Woesearchaeota archaeon]